MLNAKGGYETKKSHSLLFFKGRWMLVRSFEGLWKGGYQNRTSAKKEEGGPNSGNFGIT